MDYRKRKLEMIALRKRRWTLQEIADKFGISRARVWQIIGKVKRG
jgi:biotin operon repressor